MSLSNLASVGALVCVMMAGAVDASADQDRGRRRGRDRVVVQPRVVVRPPIVHRYARRPVVRVSPFAGRRAYRPVYRPRIGFGIYIGSPFRYGYPGYARRYYSAPYPYAYGYPYGYAYPAYSGVYAAPPVNALYGGVRLDVSPRDAAVYVDGYYAGIVDDFDGTWQRVALEPGPHRFEIAAPGYETLSFEVNVRPDQTVRYRGDMLRVGP
jgi:PEGA domain-containing protein